MRRGGFTLIEVLIALAIVALTAVTLLSTLGLGQEQAAMVTMRTRAVLLAQEKLVELEMLGYPPMAKEDETERAAEGSFDEQPSEPWRADYYWQAVFVRNPDEPGLVQLTVHVFTKRFREARDAVGAPLIAADYRLVTSLVTCLAAKTMQDEDVRPKTTP